MTSPSRPSTSSPNPSLLFTIASSNSTSPMEDVTGPSTLASTLSTLSSSVTAPVTTLKDMLKKTSSSTRSARTGRSRSSSKGRGLRSFNDSLEHADEGRADVHHKRARTADPDLKFNRDPDEKPMNLDLLRVYREEFAPLERVRSRDSGYGSGNGSPTESKRR